MNHKVGLGWRDEIALSIYSNLDQIDLVEVIIDDYFDAPAERLNSLKTLNSQTQVLYHGVKLGVASSIPVDEKQLAKLARTLDKLDNPAWSEHLAFVRAGGIEIGHLAAPPRTHATIAGTIKNLARVKEATGSLPLLENIATLIDPPGSEMGEPEWVSEILAESGAGLLLDLHNLYANAVNFGFKPLEYLRRFPLHRVQSVHLSGGKWIRSSSGELRLLDDHLHGVPDIVFEMLSIVAREARFSLSVVIERDGAYPDFSVLLGEVERARLATGQIQNEISHECR